MSSPDPPDRTKQHGDPPSLAGGAVVVRSERRLLFRAALPTAVLGAGVLVAAWRADDRAVGIAVAGLLFAASVARTAFWARGMGSRTLLSTPTHLVLCKGSVVEQWVAWNDLEHLLIVGSDPLPEWSRTKTNWFHVIPEPALAVNPPAAFLSGFGDMLLSARGSRTAVERVREITFSHGVRCDLM